MRNQLLGLLACVMVLPTAAGAQCPDGTPPPCERRPPRSAPPTNSVAVLSFRNLSQDSADAFLATGLTEELTARLGQLGRLLVKSRTAVERLERAGSMPPDQVGRALNVTYLINGSVRRSGSRVRLTIELLRAANGDQAWAEQYDREATDILAVESDIARAVTAAIVGRLLPAERSALATRPTRSPEAYEMYLRARAAWRAQPRRLADAVGLLERATRLDSGFALAFAALADAHTQMYWGGYDRSGPRLASARAAADHAIALSSQLPEARIALGYYYLYGNRDDRRALDEFRLAQHARPNDPEVLVALASVARRRGEWDLAVGGRERALALDPADTSNALELVTTLQLLRRWHDAERLLENYPATSLAVSAIRACGDLAAGRVPHAGRLTVSPAPPVYVLTVLASIQSCDGAALVRLDTALQRLASEATPAGFPVPGRFVVQFIQGYSDLLLGRAELGRSVLDSSRLGLEASLQQFPDFERIHEALALVYASLGRFEDAKRAAERAEQLLPVGADAVLGALLVLHHAEVLTMAGDYDAAINRLEYLLSIPAPVTRESLRLDPIWNPLRGQPRFQALTREN